MFEGAMVALITPFKEGCVDEESLRKLVNFQIENGISALVPCGTTGESATLSHEEHKHVIELVIEETAGRVPVLAGTGSNNTAEAIALTEHAKKAGAAGALMIAPYYNKPTQEGLYQHFKKVAETVDIPIVLYNIKSRTGINMEPETVARLAKLPGIAGIKEASGDLDQMSQVIEYSGPDFDVISGDDALTLPLMALGGKGVISVVANIAPAMVAGLTVACKAADLARARQAHFKLAPLVRAMFLETNPIPVKAAAAMMGMCSPEMRLPMTPPSEANMTRLGQVLAEYGLV